MPFDDTIPGVLTLSYSSEARNLDFYVKSSEFHILATN